MVCFQVLLLIGYWYSDKLTSAYSIPRQAVIHSLLVLVAILWVFVAPSDINNVGNAHNAPATWLFYTLLIQIGYPFFILATTSTLLQRWYTNIRHDAEVYWLYIISNAGSMLGVCGFIILIEPTIGLVKQAIFFKWVFAFLMLLLLITAIIYARLGTTQIIEKTGQLFPLEWKQKLRWLLLAAVPSSLLLSVTTHITMDIAPVPLIWMLLLALYLISFMIAFSEWKKISLGFFLKIQMFLCIPLLADFFLDITNSGGISVMLWHMAAFFVTAIVCHRILYQLRPPAAQLTVFYLYMSIGGAIGGTLTTFLAPVLFRSLLEYPLVYALALALRPAAIPISQTWRKDAVIGIAIMAAGIITLYLMRPLLNPLNMAAVGLLLMLGVFIIKFCFEQDTRPLRLGFCYLAAIISGITLTEIRGKAAEIDRNFYGIITVDSSIPDLYSMRHGTTIHGMQYADKIRHLIPLTYYHPSGPLGDLMNSWNSRKKTQHIAAIGLGVGSIACYGRKDDLFTFYEINPAVIKLAQDNRYFSFLKDCPPASKIIEGDARISIAQEKEAFDLLVVDAFTSDAIPIHLLTKQAFDLYWSHLKPGGVVFIHISNRYLDIARVLKAIADDRGMELKVAIDKDISQDKFKQPSRWAIMGSHSAIEEFSLPPRWQKIEEKNPSDLWTDDYSNIFRLLR